MDSSCGCKKRVDPNMDQDCFQKSVKNLRNFMITVHLLGLIQTKSANKILPMHIIRIVLCRSVTILIRNFRKMTILWSLVKMWEPHHNCVISKSMLYRTLFKSA